MTHFCFTIIYSNNYLEKPTEKSHLRNKERFWSDKGNFQVHQFKLEWQCFTTDSSSWRRAIGNGWANVIKEESDMQEKFKMFGKSHQTPALLLKILFFSKLHKIITKLLQHKEMIHYQAKKLSKCTNFVFFFFFSLSLTTLTQFFTCSNFWSCFLNNISIPKKSSFLFPEIISFVFEKFHF